MKQIPQQNTLTPQAIVEHLDQHIIGQKEAKKAMAIALRNRWRRLQVNPTLQAEIVPKNILMIGPTGVGKTEISRRLAKLTQAPFIKVEATTFTQVGYVGKDTESIVRDLTNQSYKLEKNKALEMASSRVAEMVEKRLLDTLLPLDENSGSATRDKLLKQLQQGKLDDKQIEIQLETTNPAMQIMGPPGMNELTEQLQNLFKSMPKPTKKRKLSIKEARQELKNQFADEVIDEEELRQNCIRKVEQSGIVFIDEIDKITQTADLKGDISREGVQRDLLPLIEGTSVQTKYGNVNTDHILFIASGAFHKSKPSDLIAELQGRLPIRVELQSLTSDDFERILSEPTHSLIKQYSALLQTEGINLKWKKNAIRMIAEIAYQVNTSTENIGARRLHTLLEKLLSEILFKAPDDCPEIITIDSKQVHDQLQNLADNKDLSQFIL